ncbi:MAG: proline dehydrogenase family protein [Prevotellaceae bacterium]|jgi:proline dehydrogenase|nr:proline dehydrogenase family protein [Prevotellaceae bacterium]
MINFQNTHIAFESKSDVDLRRAQLLFGTINRPWLVQVGKVLANIAGFIHFPVAWAVKPTIYRHFVGGETLEECDAVTKHLMKYRVYSVLDNSVEGGGTEENIRKNFDEAIRSIEYARINPAVAYAVFKPTAFINAALLEKVSSKTAPLTGEEQTLFDAYRNRFEALCRRAYDLDVRILVDAESYCFQDAIDELTDAMMRKYNRQRAIVFTTFQMYRHDRMSYLSRLYDDALANDYRIGMKFVRGAYMEKERARAHKMGYHDPICPDKPATDANFNNGLRYTVEHIDRFEIFCGTHNEESCRLLADLMAEKGLPKDDSRIFFAQLYGMSDNLSFNLAHEGYNACKYVPYAPVNDVLPYLIRRAEENTSIAGQTSRELTLIASEIARRKNRG